MNPCLILLAGRNRPDMSVYAAISSSVDVIDVVRFNNNELALSAPRAWPADDMQVHMVHLLPAIRSDIEKRLVAAATSAVAVALIAAPLLLRQFWRQQHHLA